MYPRRVYLTPDGKLYADAGADILDDQERNDAWLASGGTLDPTDAPVEGTPEGTLLVDVGGCKRIPFALVETVDGMDVVPVELADHGGGWRSRKQATSRRFWECF